MRQTIVVNSLIGPLRLLSDDKGLVALDFLKSKEVQPKKKERVEDASAFRSQEKALKDFFSKGKSLPKFAYGNRGGTDFQRKVWREIEKIPLGKTRTYAEIAKAVGSPGAARAVGSACGANPIPLFVPCHRVVASNGIGGYGGSAARAWRPAGQDPIAFKRALLAREGVLVR